MSHHVYRSLTRRQQIRACARVPGLQTTAVSPFIYLASRHSLPALLSAMLSLGVATVPALVAALLAVEATGTGSLTVPAWDFDFPTQHDMCFDPGGGHAPRWVFTALPQGPPPAAGWPAVLWLVTDQFPVPRPGAECGGQGIFTRKHFRAWSTPADSMASCFPSNRSSPHSAGRRHRRTSMIGRGAMGVRQAGPPPSPLPFPPGAAPYWRCSSMVDAVCGTGGFYVDTAKCLACVHDEKNAKALAGAGCTKEMLGPACSLGFDSCQDALNDACGRAGGPGECACALEPGNAAALMAGNCTATLMHEYGCTALPSHCMYDQQVRAPPPLPLAERPVPLQCCGLRTRTHAHTARRHTQSARAAPIHPPSPSSEPTAPTLWPCRRASCGTRGRSNTLLPTASR